MDGEKCLYMKVFKKRGFGDTRIRDKYLKYLKEFKIYISSLNINILTVHI